jgi:hypothetical protein
MAAMSTFKLNATWANNANAKNEIDATLASLMVQLDEKNLTAYRTQQGRTHATLRVPTYYIGEWIAENWWPLLYEPRKGKDEEADPATEPETDSEEFLARHSLLAAQHGFALPAVLFVPMGKAVRISAVPRTDDYADAEFRVRGLGSVERTQFAASLDRFVSGTMKELNSHKMADTPLEEAWARVKDTTPEEEEFCQLIGSLGLCPYDVDDSIADAVDMLVDILGSRATRDFCLAVSEEEVGAAVTPIEFIAQSLLQSRKSSLAPILGIDLPPETFAQDSWIRGLTAAMRVSSTLKIASADQRGADRVFDLLQIDTNNVVRTQSNINRLPFAGAVDRQEESLQVAFLQEREDVGRFAAARSIYLAWVSEQQSRRLITQARTRDQQASRQFAAELLVPREYLRSTVEGGMLYDEQVREIAWLRKANPAVVRYQANNMGLALTWG